MEVLDYSRRDVWIVLGDHKDCYTVERVETLRGRELLCNCPDFNFRKAKDPGRVCKHVQTALSFEIMRLEAELRRIRGI